MVLLDWVLQTAMKGPLNVKHPFYKLRFCHPESWQFNAEGLLLKMQ